MMPVLRSRILVVAAVTLLLAGRAMASLIVYDGFDYTAGTGIEGQGSGSGWGQAVWYDNSGNGVNNTVTSPGFTYSAMPTAGNRVTTAGGNNGSFRFLGTQGGSGTLYVSFLVQRASGGSSGYGGLSLFTGNSSEHLFIGQRFNQDVFGVERSGGGGANSGTTAATLSFLVARIDFNGANSSARLYVNPGLGSEPGTAQATLSGFSSFNFDTVRIQSGDPTFHFDELRIGTTYADVAPVPEPAVQALLLFAGGAALLGAARRWKFARKGPAS
jgi:hypothetical protein